MKLFSRIIIPLLILIVALAVLVTVVTDKLSVRWFTRDLELRGSLITRTIHDSLAEAVQKKDNKKIQSLFARVVQDERLTGLILCNEKGREIARSRDFPDQLTCRALAERGFENAGVIRNADKPLYISIEKIPVSIDENYYLIPAHDMGYVNRRTTEAKKYIFGIFIVVMVILSAVVFIISRISLKELVHGMQSLLRSTVIREKTYGPAELRPLIKDMRFWVDELEANRIIRDESQLSWTSQSLKQILHNELAGNEVLIVSNREPYIHVKNNSHTDVQIPASGLVTALEPIMRACSGTWIAHGSGNADRLVVDENDRVWCPPGEKSYLLRRVWLSKAEEKGYYYGFSNEGLWPLCHIAHTRPIFRNDDWETYKAVNQKFADVLFQEVKTDAPVILIQDYHFALLPRLIRNRYPNAVIITFWHVPWPNAESYSICPWREEILDGLLGSSIIGFHTRYHVINFLDTVDRFLEARISRDSSTISFKGEVSAIHAYPISIQYPSRFVSSLPTQRECRKYVEKNTELLPNVKMGIGVDRLDYTKGVIEKFYAIDRLFEINPGWIKKFSFVQVGAPTRVSIPTYRSFHDEIIFHAEQINKKYEKDGWKPIILQSRHHDAQEVYRYLRAADFCFVNSLHDGMNLVAKEFIASREHDDGVLILSQFTGASLELIEALVVNPYNVDQCASAINMALEMNPEDQRLRMINMKSIVQEYNVYRWAGRMLLDAARLIRSKKFLYRDIV